MSDLTLQARLTPEKIELLNLRTRVAEGQNDTRGAVELDHLQPRAFSLDLLTRQLKPRVGLPIPQVS